MHHPTSFFFLLGAQLIVTSLPTSTIAHASMIELSIIFNDIRPPEEFLIFLSQCTFSGNHSFQNWTHFVHNHANRIASHFNIHYITSHLLFQVVHGKWFLHHNVKSSQSFRHSPFIRFSGSVELCLRSENVFFRRNVSVFRK